MPAPSSSSARLPAALVEWISSLVSTIPILKDVNEGSDQPKRDITNLVTGLNDGLVLGQIVAQM